VTDHPLPAAGQPARIAEIAAELDRVPVAG
jgi:hypothetical protein